MRQITEIETVLKNNNYSINCIIIDLLKKFKLKTLICKSGIEKNDVYSASEIITLLVLLPIMFLKSVYAIYQSDFKNKTQMKKDVLYRFKNNEKIAWRKLLFNVVKTFKSLNETAEEKAESIGKTAFVLDDTINGKVGYKGEKITKVFDHSIMKSVYGFKNLVLGYFDGTSIIPLDFALHSEKKLDKKRAKKQYTKKVIKNSAGEKRRNETTKSKIDNAIAMLKRAVKHGFTADYVLVDSWFTSLDFVKNIRAINKGSMHLIAGIRNDKRKYTYDGQMFNAKEIINKLKLTSKEKRCRTWNIRYYEACVNYDGVGEVKLMICRYPFQKKYRIFISTDTSLSFVETMKIYGIRWTIEVMFRDLKQHLNFGKCESRDFDAQIANATISLILFVLLAYEKRCKSYTSMGELYRITGSDIIEKNVAQKFWKLFEESLQLILEVIGKDGLTDITTLKLTEEYKYIEQLFTSSFLDYQISNVNISA